MPNCTHFVLRSCLHPWHCQDIDLLLLNNPEASLLPSPPIISPQPTGISFALQANLSPFIFSLTPHKNVPGFFFAFGQCIFSLAIFSPFILGCGLFETKDRKTRSVSVYLPCFQSLPEVGKNTIIKIKQQPSIYMFLKWGNFVLQITFGNIWRHFIITIQGNGLVASSEYRSMMLPNIL